MTETAKAEHTAVSPVVALLGRDILGAIIYELKTQPDHWARLSEETQKRQLEGLRDKVRAIVQNAVRVMVSGADFRSVQVELEGMTFKDGIKGSFTLDKSEPNRHELADAIGRRVVIVMATPEAFLQRIDDVKAATDQLDLFGGDYDPMSDQPGYRRDEKEDRLSPARTGMMSWADLKAKLASGEITQKEAEDAYGGELPGEEPKPAQIETNSPAPAPESVPAALTEYRAEGASPVDRMKGDGEMEVVKLKKIGRGEVVQIAERLYTTKTPALKDRDGTYVVQLEETKPLAFGTSVVDEARAARQELLERLNGVHIMLSLATLQTFTPEQMRVTREWLDAYAADPEGCKIARPHFLPLPDKADGADDSKPSEG